MPDPNLINYIKNSMTSGYTKEQIKQTLLQQGYNIQTVNEAFLSLQQPYSSPNTKNQSPMKYFEKLKRILFQPRKVLEELYSEEGIKEPFMFFLISVIIATLISTIFNIIGGSELKIIFTSFVGVIIYDFVLVFGFSGLFHLLVKLLGGKNPYYQTFKAFAYLSAFWIVGTVISSLATYLSFLNIFILILGLWVLILVGSCLKLYTGLSSSKLMIVWFIVLVILLILFYFLRPLIISVLVMRSF